MLTVVIARPPSTYTFITSLQFISILEKLYFLLLHVESNRFLALLKFLSCYYWCGVVAAGGSASCYYCCYERELLCYIQANQQCREIGFEALSLFSLSCSHSLFETVK